MPTLDQIGEIISRARAVAADYYRVTGKPLGITGEVGEYEAARCLNLELARARAAGHDATDSKGRRLQIKARSIPSGKRHSGQRIGSIDLEKQWDAVILVLLDENFLPIDIYEADREAIEQALNAPGSKARNERRALAVTKFKSIGRRVWRAR